MSSVLFWILLCHSKGHCALLCSLFLAGNSNISGKMEILEDGGRIMRSVPVSGPHSMHNTFNKKNQDSQVQNGPREFSGMKSFTRMGTYILTYDSVYKTVHQDLD